MKTAELSDLTAHPEKLVELVESGEPTEIVQNGKTLASIVPFPQSPAIPLRPAPVPVDPDRIRAAIERALTVGAPTCDIEQMLEEIDRGGRRSSWP